LTRRDVGLKKAAMSNEYDIDRGTADVIVTSSLYEPMNDAYRNGGNVSLEGEGEGGELVFKFSWGAVKSLNYYLPTMILVAIVLFVVIVATAFGNFLVGLALFRYRYLRTISNYLIGLYL